MIVEVGKKLEKFYFKSYDMIVGEASDVLELGREIKRLSAKFPGAIEYHLKAGHIVEWLESIGEIEIGERMKGITNIAKAENILDKPMEEIVIVQRMSRGRMH